MSLRWTYFGNLHSLLLIDISNQLIHWFTCVLSSLLLNDWLCTCVLSHANIHAQNLPSSSAGSPFNAVSSSPNAVAYIWFVFCSFLIHSASSDSSLATSLSIYIRFSFSSLILRISSYLYWRRFCSFSIIRISIASSFWFRTIYFILWAFSSSVRFWIAIISSCY